MTVAGLNAALRRVPAWVLYPLGMLPAAFLLFQAATGRLGVDPVKAIEHQLGEYGLQLLLLGLAVTPLRRLAGLNLLRFRRAIGVLAFVYVGLHLASWLLLDLQLRWAEIGADLTRRPYIVVGMLAFIVLVPLAATSNDASVRRLGAAAWRRLHLLVYPAVLLGAVHFVMVGKTWATEPLVYLGLAGALVGLRLWWARARSAAAAA